MQEIKDVFPEFYPLTPAAAKQLWDKCLFVFDANVFLDLYRYSLTTRNELIEILFHISERIWEPHQVVLEYLKNRPDVIWTQVSFYEKTKSILQSLREKAKEEIEKNLTFRHHPFIEQEKFYSAIEAVLANIENGLEREMQDYPNDLASNDSILDIITNLLDGKVGQPYSEQKLIEIYKDGEKRFDPDIPPGQVPPGYEDAKGPNKKKGYEQYGDLVLWYQIIDKAKQSNEPIIFITNDTKEDWWWIAKGRTVGPRPELVKEIMARANVNFYMYNINRFMSYARIYFGIEVEQEAIDEAQDVIRDREAIMKELIEAWERARIRSGLSADPSPYSIHQKAMGSDMEGTDFASQIGLDDEDEIPF